MLESTNALSQYGDVMGFYVGKDGPEVSFFHHWQGIQRLMALNGNHLVVTNSDSKVGGMAIISMESRHEGNSRLRSNRLGRMPGKVCKRGETGGKYDRGANQLEKVPCPVQDPQQSSELYFVHIHARVSSLHANLPSSNLKRANGS